MTSNTTPTAVEPRQVWHVIRHSDDTFGIARGKEDWGTWSLEAAAQTEADSRNRNADGTPAPVGPVVVDGGAA